jgi:hypothetical protein
MGKNGGWGAGGGGMGEGGTSTKAILDPDTAGKAGMPLLLEA